MKMRLIIGLMPLLSAACVTTTTTSRTWGAAGPPERLGQVAWIREVVQQQEGNPAGGAVLGAVVGGVLGSAVTGRAGGTLLGAVGGAAVGASASQGSAERVTYQVAVRFDDGGQRVFRYGGASPFRVGERVAWSDRGLRPARSPGPPPGPPLVPPPPPPSYAPPPPPPGEGPPPP